jgi:hypothetical protein
MKRISISELRKMNAAYLRSLIEPVEICGRDLQPLRVLVPYEMFLQLQDEGKRLQVAVKQLEKQVRKKESK